jgi:hypothetical protein
LGNCLECKINEATDEEKREKLLGKSKHIFELIEHEDFQAKRFWFFIWQFKAIQLFDFHLDYFRHGH